jgi:hypothetical protein
MAADRSTLKGPIRLTDAVDKQFHMAASGADIHIEALPLDEQLADLAQGSPVGALMETFRPDVRKRLVAAKTLQIRYRATVLRRGVWHGGFLKGQIFNAIL